MRHHVALGCVLLCGTIKAQAYIPFLAPNSIWQDEYGWASPGPNTASYECRRYYLDGDTILDDISYRILRQSGHSAYTGSSQWFAGKYVALLREDTSTRRVHIRPLGWSTDQLLYDFSPVLGPYPATYRFSQSTDFVVTAVDTILLGVTPHRRIHLGQSQVLIEGIGAISGFLPSMSSGEVNWLQKLVCHSYGTFTNYIVNSQDCVCGPEAAVADQRPSSIRVGPSPTTDYCTLTGGAPNSPFLVRTMDGRIIRTGSCSGNGSAMIDLTGLPAAIYLLEVLEAKGKNIARVIKQ